MSSSTHDLYATQRKLGFTLVVVAFLCLLINMSVPSRFGIIQITDTVSKIEKESSSQEDFIEWPSLLIFSTSLPAYRIISDFYFSHESQSNILGLLNIDSFHLSDIPPPHSPLA